jgi:hypothetical protein
MDGTRLVNKSVPADEALTIRFSTGKLKSRDKKAQQANRED